MISPLQLKRVLTVLLVLATVSACATIEDFLDTVRGQRAGTRPVPIEARPIEEPIDANRFTLESPDQSVVGVPQVVYPRSHDTLSDLAREYGLGYDELIAANPNVDRWLPGEKTAVLLPTQYVLPDVPHQGIVLNIASKRLFYFPETGSEVDPESGESPPQVVLTFPIGIGRVGWETPLGSTSVIEKATDPHWWVPASVRKEHAEMGDPLPAVVPPGPDNPLGTRVLRLEMPGYLIHGTNQPYGVGMRVSHGCVRLYPENIEFLYELVGVGEPVTIINEPYLLGRLNDDWYFESHMPLEDDPITPEERLEEILNVAGESLDSDLGNHTRAIASIANGVPVMLAKYDADEALARAKRVHNTVEDDPDAPSLDEVRQMIDAAVAEAELEAANTQSK